MTIEDSYKYCEKIAKEHYENFPIASFFIPKEKRKYIYSIYAYARAADDFADEKGIGDKEPRLKLLDEWNCKLINASNGKADEPVFIAIKQTMKDCDIPIEPLENLLKAFKQDVIKKRYNDFDEVLQYCVNSANPVGRLVLMVFGIHDEKYFALSDKICTALQLTNFWQDVEIDMRKDRIYIPQEEMKSYGYSDKELFDKVYNDNFVKLMKFQVERTEGLFQDGKALIKLISGNPLTHKLARELKLIWLGGMEILKSIKKADYNVFKFRPEITFRDKLKLFYKSGLSIN
jgi:squalene synthase HpnC